MTGNDLFREMGNINEKYVKEAEEAKRATILTPAFRRTIATAACLVICFGLYFGVQQLGMGGQSETASMESNTSNATGQADMSIKAESAVMDSATTNSVAGAGEDGMYEAEEDSAFWEDIWSTENETAEGAPEVDEEYYEQVAGSESVQGDAQEAPIQDSMQESEMKAQDARSSEAIGERFDGYVQDLEYWPAEMAVLDEDSWLQSGLEEVNAFIAKTEKGEEASLELVRTSDEGVYAFYYIHYNGGDYYLLTDWRYPDKEEAAEVREATYGYLKVFEETLENGSTYFAIGLGVKEDFTLRDLQIGTNGTLAILRCMK